MNWLDNTIGFLSPARQYKREIYRQALDEMRGYDAGGNGRINANWRAWNESAETTDRGSRNTIRARARDLERNSDMMNSLIKAFRRNVVGAGYQLQAATGSEELNQTIERTWKRWCKKQNCDVTGTQSFKQLLQMAVTRKKVDGGMLFVKCYTAGGILPFKLQAIEVDELDETQMVPESKANKVIGGIEYNAYNRPVGYYIRQYRIDGMAEEKARYVPAKDVIYLYTKNRPSQIREISDLCATIGRVRDTNEFMTAVSVKERVAACLAVFIKREFPTTGTGRSAGKEIRDSYEGKSITPGMIKELNMGDEAQFLNPSGQAADAAEFIRIQQRMIGAGQGLSYEATARDMSKTNYSSARSAILEDELTYAEEKELIVNDFMTEVYESFVISGVLDGVFNIPDFWGHKEDYLEHTWVAAPKRWIDPAKEANANKIALEKGQKTFKQIAAENGKDWHDQIDDMAEVLEYAKSKGLDMGNIVFGNGGRANGMEEKREGEEKEDEENE